MDARDRLRKNIVAESRPYGYSLTVWSGGHLLVAVYGIPSVLDVFAYVAGALGTFVVLTAIAFGGVVATTSLGGRKELLGVTATHVVATAVTLSGGWLLLLTVRSAVSQVVSFLVLAIAMTLSYHLLLLLEPAVSRAVVAAVAPDEEREL
ncbi:MAG: hypothetical protein ABEJ26_09355 [Halosimplex sp.]